MEFKQFVDWCNNRASDGCWGYLDALVCIDIIETVKKIPLLEREKYWKDNYESQVIDEIINPIESKYNIIFNKSIPNSKSRKSIKDLIIKLFKKERK